MAASAPLARRAVVSLSVGQRGPQGELLRTPLRRSSNREGHSPGPFDRAPPNRSAYLYSVNLGLCGLPEASQPPIPPFICANLISGAFVLPR
jgi:hypothetical protein